MNSVQPLHRKRGRPPSLMLRVYREDLDDYSRRALYYRHAFDRVRVLAVETG